MPNKHSVDVSSPEFEDYLMEKAAISVLVGIAQKEGKLVDVIHAFYKEIESCSSLHHAVTDALEACEIKP